MSQMKPYCFKCGAELDPEAIYCPECGRLQRSMVVRAVEPGAASPPPAPQQDASRQQPLQFYPNREAPAAPAEPQPDEASSYSGSTWQQPDQPDQYAQQYADQGWPAGEQAPAETEPGQAYGQDAWPTEPAAPYGAQEQAGGDQVYAQQAEDEPEASWSQGYDGYPQHDQAHEQPQYGQQEPAYGDSAQAYNAHGYDDQQQGAYEEPGQAYGHEHAYGEAQPYGERQEAHEQPAASAYDAPAHGQAAPQPYEDQPGEPAEPAPAWYRASASSAPPGAAGAEPAVPPVPPIPPPAPDPWRRRPEPSYSAPEPSYSAPEPIYSSSPSPPAAGAYRPRTAGPASNPYSPAASNPYAPTYRPTTGDQGQGPSRVRIVALIGAALLGLFLIAFAIGQFLGSRGESPSSPTAITSLPPASTQPTVAPTSAPSGTPAAKPTADQGIVGNAKFQRVSSSIPGRCTTSQGCPIQVTLKNNGGQGSGTVTVTLTDAQGGGNQIATFSGSIPVTDAGGTVQVTGFATGDQLPAYLKGGGTVYITTVDIKNGG